MELIRVAKNGGAVTLRVEIEGALAWHYGYQAENVRFTGKSSQPGPREHALGLPKELDTDVNGWDVHLFNLTDQTVDYSITLTWVQNGNEIHQWNREGALASETLVAEKGDAFFFIPG